MAGLAGCGMRGASPISQSPGPTSVLFIGQPPTSLAVNASASIDAAAIYPTGVAAATQNSRVNYSIACGSTGACGTLSASNMAGAIVYTAPPAIPSGGNVTITATAQADSTKSRSATITIVPPIPISVSFEGTTPASQQVNTTIAFRALISNDVIANPQVTWTIACGGTACGAISPATTSSEQPSTFTAPSAIPPGSNVTITATSVTDPAKSASASIVITPAAPTLSDGSYVFQIVQPTGFITGTLVARGGAITGGEQDVTMNDGENPQYAQFQQITGGNYTTTPSGNLQVNVQIGAYETETFNGTLASSGKGFLAGLNGIPSSGTLDLQTSMAPPSGGYAVSLYTGTFISSPAWIYGILNIDSPGGISGNGSTLDIVGGPATYGNTVTFSASTVSAPDAFGRVAFQLNPGANSPLPALYLAGYIVDGTHIRLNQATPPGNVYAYGGISGGTALGQGAITGMFNAATLAGSSYVFGAQGNDTQGSLQLAGVLNFNPGSSVSGTLNWNDLSDRTPQPPLTFTGTYTVDSTGRVTLSNLTDGTTFKYSLHLYLDGNGGGLVLSNNGDNIFVGQAFQRQTAPFSAASFSGSYGLNASAYSLQTNGQQQWSTVVGALTATANSTSTAVAGFADANSAPADFALAGSFTPASNGVFQGTLGGFSGASPTTANDFTVYLVDSTQALAIETDNSQLILGRLQLVQ